MESVKEERVSPLLGEGGGSYGPLEVNPRPCVLQPPQPAPPAPPHTNNQKTVKPYLSVTPAQTNSLATVITTVSSSGDLPRTAVSGRPGSAEDGVVETVLLSTAQSFSGEISEAVSKILEDYDWSKIPLANK